VFKNISKWNKASNICKDYINLKLKNSYFPKLYNNQIDWMGQDRIEKERIGKEKIG
jgi:hypothetical protein